MSKIRYCDLQLLRWYYQNWLPYVSVSWKIQRTRSHLQGLRRIKHDYQLLYELGQIHYRLRRKCFAVSRFKVSISTAYSSKHGSHCKSGTLNFRSFLTCWRCTAAEVPGLAHPHGLDLFQDALLARSVLISRRHSQRRVVHSQEGNCRFQRF